MVSPAKKLLLIILDGCTYFMNGALEAPHRGEVRLHVPSPTNDRFDEAPEMSAREVTEALILLFT